MWEKEKMLVAGIFFLLLQFFQKFLLKVVKSGWFGIITVIMEVEHPSKVKASTSDIKSYR